MRFREYVHEKVIMGNRVPIEASEIIDYIIDGIPDDILRNQARIQCFTETELLLEAFEAITLRNVAGLSRPNRWGSGSTTSERDGEKKKNTNGNKKKKTTLNVRKYFNCDMREHISANCPSKSLGSKCFGCGEFGYIAFKYPRGKDASKSSCTVFFKQEI